MNFQFLVRGACAILASLILGSCGGGGAKVDPNEGGTDVQIFPSTGTFYAGVTSRITIAGGRTPYSLTSSEPTVLDVPATTSAHFIDVTPNNPGTVDAGLPPGSLPVRTVNITARASNGATQTAQIKVAHNFLTGYTINFTPSNCPSGANACAGGETVVQWDTVTNGVRIGNRPFTVQVEHGQCLLENPPNLGSPGSANLATVINTASDHEGKVTVVLFCPANIAAQVGLLRLIETNTGASTTAAFTVTEAAASQNLVAIPSSFDFVGPDSATCGTGTQDFFVFGGLAPYAAVSSDANVTITPIDATHTPGHFQVSATNSLKCVTATGIITDATGGRTTIDVKTEVGSAAPTPPAVPLVVTPSSVTLTCGQSASVLVTGGSGGSISAASTSSNVTATVSGNTVTITRLLQANNPVGSVTTTVNITDGTNISPVSVVNPATCT